MKRSGTHNRFKTLLKVLSAQHKALFAARGDKALIADYAALIQFLRSATRDEIEDILSRNYSLPFGGNGSQPEYDDSEIKNMTLENIETLISDQTTPRKFLERIAIHRFRVPQGSMRSFSNRQLLVEKLLTLIQNERAHATIDKVARGRAEQS